MQKRDRGILIAGNWKMNHGPEATRGFFRQLKQLGVSTLGSSGLRCSIYPPAVSLAAALEAAESEGLSQIRIGAQNAHWEKSGAFTGELSGPLLGEVCVHTVLIGHSERRQLFGETDETVRKRAQSLLTQGFEVILCIGETREEREAGKTEAVLERQLSAIFGTRERGAEYPARAYLSGPLVIAYEPVWAIGTGLTATPEQAQQAHAFVRGWLRQSAGAAAAEATPILYGGSVTPQNSAALLSCPDIDGALVGGASLKPESFHALLQAGAQALS